MGDSKQYRERNLTNQETSINDTSLPTTPKDLKDYLSINFFYKTNSCIMLLRKSTTHRNRNKNLNASYHMSFIFFYY